MAIIGIGSTTLTDMNDVYASKTAPLNPKEGALWFNQNDEVLYIYNNGEWVDAMPDIEIGSRNLLLDSYMNNFTFAGSGAVTSINIDTGKQHRVAFSGANTYFALMSPANARKTNYRQGKSYTISMDLRGNVTDMGYTYLMREDGANIIYPNTTVALSTTEFTRVSFTREAPWSTEVGYILVGSRDTGAGKWFEIKNLKIEEGKISTGWSPSPEDVQYQLDNTSETVEFITHTLGNMANDNLLDFKERSIIKDRLNDIIGYNLANNAVSLPITATLDASVRGSFYFIRRSALNAGIESNHAKYIDVSTKYETLKNYLTSLNPIKPWNLLDADKDKVITVVKATFINNWLNYFNSVNDLATYTAQVLKENVDNIQVGSRNITYNSTFKYGFDSWGKIAYANIISPESDKPDSPIMHMSWSTTSSLASPYFNNPRRWIETDGTKDYTLSLDFYCEDLSAWDGSSIAGARIFDASIGGTLLNAYTISKSIAIGQGLVSGKWHRILYTFKPASSGYISTFVYINGTKGDYKYREIQLEKGNIATDWKPAIEDSSYETGNLVDNPAVTGGQGRWNASGGLSVVDHIFRDVSIPVLQSSISANTQNFSGWFNVDPSKAYEVSMWIKKSSQVGRFYLGLNATNGLDGTGSTVGIEEINDSTGAIINANQTNFYFTASIANESPTDWEKISVYIMPSGTDEAEMIGMGRYPEGVGTKRNARMKPNTKSMRLRLLNWENGATALDLWCALPKVVETDPNSVVRGALVNMVESKLNEFMFEMTNENILFGLTESTEFKAIMESKIDSDGGLDGYALSSEVESLERDMEDRLNEALGTIDLSPYEKSADIDLKINELDIRFSRGGGVNLVRNSTGYAGHDFWTVAGGGVLNTITRNESLTSLGFDYGFNFGLSGTNAKSIRQTINVVPGVPHTFSCYIKKNGVPSTDNVVYVNIYDSDTTLDEIVDARITVSHSHAPDYDKYETTFIPESSKVTVRIYAQGGVDDAVVSGIMVNLGTIPLTWTMHPQETYNTNIKMDLNGIKVSQTNTNDEVVGFTVMTPNKFAGYYNEDPNATINESNGSPDEVFRVDKDEFVMNKAVIRPIKIVPIRSTNFNGIAFLAED